MQDNELYTLLIATIQTAEPDFGIPNIGMNPGVPVLQSYQPTQQGVITGPGAFLEIIGTQPWGQPLREDYIDPDTMLAGHRETQILLTKFQMSGLSTQDPTSTTQYTAQDIVVRMFMILQNQQTITTLMNAGCGIQIASDIRNPKFLDDRERFEASPSFDFDITHKLIVTRSQNVIQSTELQIYPV